MRTKRFLKIAIAVTLGLISCCNSSHIAKAIRVKINIKFLRPETDSLSTIKDSVDIIYYDNKYTILKLSQINFTAKATPSIDGSFSMVRTSKDIIKYYYAVSDNSNGNGYIFDSLGVSSPHKINFDSLLTAKAHKNFVNYQKDNDSILMKVNKSGLVIEKHIFKVRQNSSFCDTIFYTYNKTLNNFEFSFSKTLDSLKKMKLVGIEYIYNEQPKSKNIQNREFSFEMNQISPLSVDTIKILLKKIHNQN